MDKSAVIIGPNGIVVGFNREILIDKQFIHNLFVDQPLIGGGVLVHQPNHRKIFFSDIGNYQSR